MELTWLGTLGLLFVVGSWIPQIRKLWKEKHSGLSLPFAIVYFFGSLLLTLHAWIIQDMIFLLLNGLLTILAGISLFFTIKYQK